MCQRQGDGGHLCEMAPARRAGKAPADIGDPLETFRREVTHGGTAFLTKDEKRAAAARGAVTALFAQLSSCAAAEGIDLPLPELHTDGLDAEQVWMQIEMQLEPLLAKAKGALRRLKPVMSAGDELDVERLLRLPEGAEASGSDSEETPEWEEIQEGVEYDMADEDEDTMDDEEEEDDEEDEGVKKQNKKQPDLTKKIFKNPGMFSLSEMEDFALQAEEQEELRLAKLERREQKRAAANTGEDSDSESESDALDAQEDSDDSDDLDDSFSDSDDDMADLIGDAAAMAGVERPSSQRSNKQEKQSQKKKGKDLMFGDFFGDGGKSRGKKQLDEDERSDEEEDVFGEMERGEMEGLGGSGSGSGSDEDLDALDQEDEDALRAELEEELKNELAEGSEEDADDGGFEDEEEEDEEMDEDDEGEEEEEAVEAIAAASLAARKDYAPSAFQRVQDKLAKQISSLEKRALDEKTWLLKGEANASERPKNSVLEADLEFDHVASAPPVVSEEMTAKLEDIIKARIVEQRFDDVERVEPGLNDDKKRRQFTELDDQKSKKGLGDIYADDYVAQKHLKKTGKSLEEDKEEPLVVEARALFAKLSNKLDALSNFHFAPRPTVEELEIKTDAPALQVEEVAPVMSSGDAAKAPEEVFAGGEGAGGMRGSAAGDIKADGELTKEDRAAARAKRKRKAKAVGNEKERVKVKREREKEAKEKAAEDAGFTRKVPKVAMLAAAPAGGRSKSEFSKSSKVFSMLQEAKEADALGVGKPKKSDGMKNKSSLKL